MKKLIALLLFLNSLGGNAQSFWKTYLITPSITLGNLWAYKVIQTSDGGYAFTTPSIDNTGTQPNFTVVKTDGSGNVQWSNAYDSLFYMDEPRQIMQLADNSFAIVGVYGNGPLYYWHINSSGALLSVKRILTSGLTDIYSACVGSDGNLVVAGACWNDNIIMKFDTGGIVLWAKGFGHGINNTFSYLHKIISTTDGGLLAAGYLQYYDTTLSAPDTFMVEILKVSGSGNLQWFRQLGPAQTTGTWINDICETSTGDFLICGQYYYSARSDCLIKLDTSGNVKWFKSLGGGSNTVNGFVKEKPDGNYLLGAGQVNYPVVHTIDTSGNVLSGYRYVATSMAVHSIISTLDNGVAVLGRYGQYIHLLKIDNILQAGCLQSQNRSPAVIPFSLSTAVNETLLTTTVQDLTSSYTVTPVQSVVTNPCFTTEINNSIIINYPLLSPNPATTQIRIDPDSYRDKVQSIHIYNVTGQLQPSHFNLQTNTIDISELTPGIYFVTLKDDAGNKAVRKVVKM